MQITNGIVLLDSAERALLDYVGIHQCSGLLASEVGAILREFVGSHSPADAIGYANLRIVGKLLQQLEGMRAGHDRGVETHGRGSARTA